MQRGTRFTGNKWSLISKTFAHLYGRVFYSEIDFLYSYNMAEAHRRVCCRRGRTTYFPRMHMCYSMCQSWAYRSERHRLLEEMDANFLRWI